jgi:hypothetical protein
MALPKSLVRASSEDNATQLMVAVFLLLLCTFVALEATRQVAAPPPEVAPIESQAAQWELADIWQRLGGQVQRAPRGDAILRLSAEAELFEANSVALSAEGVRFLDALRSAEPLPVSLSAEIRLRTSSVTPERLAVVVAALDRPDLGAITLRPGAGTIEIVVGRAS